MTDYPTQEPETRARRRMRSRYDRPRRFVSWTGLLLGMILALGASLYITRTLIPLPATDTAPWQLPLALKRDYVVAIVLDYAIMVIWEKPSNGWWICACPRQTLSKPLPILPVTSPPRRISAPIAV